MTFCKMVCKFAPQSSTILQLVCKRFFSSTILQLLLPPPSRTWRIVRPAFYRLDSTGEGYEVDLLSYSLTVNICRVHHVQQTFADLPRVHSLFFSFLTVVLQTVVKQLLHSPHSVECPYVKYVNCSSTFLNFSPNIHQNVANMSLSILQQFVFDSHWLEYICRLARVTKNSSEKVRNRLCLLSPNVRLSVGYKL